MNKNKIRQGMQAKKNSLAREMCSNAEVYLTRRLLISALAKGQLAREIMWRHT